MKEQAWKLIKKGKMIEQRIDGAMLLFKAHFDRSLALAIGHNYWKKQPSFKQYISMMYYEYMVPGEIMKEIRKKYPYMKGQIASGHTNWCPPKSNARKRQFSIIYK